MRHVLFPVVLMALLAGCSGISKNELYLLKAPQSQGGLANRLGRVEVMQVALPDYAIASEMTVQDKDGVLRTQKRQLWADKPVNAITQLLANEISDQSKATAIVEPWPLSDPADRKLEVRIADIYAGNDGQFHLAGQYFVSSTGSSGADTVRRFKLSVPLADDSFGALVAAQSQALQDLARNISQLK